jgi:AsmA protein
LKLTFPSVNLVRANDGRWNLESLLEQARKIPSAPTAKKAPERARARFPYIEADAGRINLKIGNEKKVFALNDADFSLWLAAEDEWRMRLKARPLRTDANLSDVGTIKMEGTWRRAPTLHETPVQLRLWWEDGQLGQLTSLIYGRDRGWRGTTRASATIAGTPDNLKIATDARVDDFRRYDISTAESVTLQAHCDLQYSFSEHLATNLGCQSPFGGGLIQAHGSFGVISRHDLDLSLSAENVLAQFLAVLLRHMKR